MWSGAVDTIPQGWTLCDGENGTPDLRGKFVVGANDRFAHGSSTDLGENVGQSESKCAPNPPGLAGGRAGKSEGFVAGNEYPDRDGHLAAFCRAGHHDYKYHPLLDITWGEPVPAHYALAYIMQLDVEFEL